MTLLATTLARLRSAWQHAGLRRAGSSAGWMRAERLVRLAGGTFVGIWLARYYGPADFGVYNFAIALSIIVISLTTPGRDGILAREPVRDPAGAGRLLGSTALLRLAGGLGASLAIVALAAGVRPDDPAVVALTAIIGVTGVLQASTMIDLWFRARLAARDPALAHALAYLAAVLRAGLILAGAPLIAFALLMTLLAGPLTVLLLAAAYADAAPSLVALTWAGLFGSSGVARSSFLTADNSTGLHLAAVALGCVANLGLNWWLIPPLGGPGAAIASLISCWLAVHGSCFRFPALRPTRVTMARALLWRDFCDGYVILFRLVDSGFL
ncbi:MAG: polysaccharide biosynthesis C-terminal domain-containing protein [Oscillochloridaceae bacterium]|nr:polysaccharide biosynthesis C-terminal domain-containing protein [Chloroflexaceae bacterium]MDW8388735.1 polysaccharide biosynthesis C-terminal domain-containing protein [Oscillochloridaceae bacterium]